MCFLLGEKSDSNTYNTGFSLSHSFLISLFCRIKEGNLSKKNSDDRMVQGKLKGVS
jgi:hypothetical protein